MDKTHCPSPGSAAPAVLLVDDDLLVRESLVDLLRELDIPVFEASGGTEAMGVLREQSDIAVLVTDMMMPGMNGYTLARAARGIRPGLRVLFLSGLDRPPLGEAFLAKPVLADQLLEMVGGLLACAEETAK